MSRTTKVWRAATGKTVAVGPPSIGAVTGDITTQEVDAVVNAAQRPAGRGRRGGRGHPPGRRGGPAAGRLRRVGGCDPGDAKATPGFGLRARWIIHTVGPVWTGGRSGEAEILASCYRRSLAVAGALGARSVAFPAISTGVYGYPADLAAEVAVASVKGTPTEVELVRLVAFDEATRQLYVRLLAGRP